MKESWTLYSILILRAETNSGDSSLSRESEGEPIIKKMVERELSDPLNRKDFGAVDQIIDFQILTSTPLELPSWCHWNAG